MRDSLLQGQEEVRRWDCIVDQIADARSISHLTVHSDTINGCLSGTTYISRLVNQLRPCLDPDGKYFATL